MSNGAQTGGRFGRSSVPLSHYTTFRIGGPCSELIECATPDELESVVRDLNAGGRAFEVMGGGSNLLVADDGFSAVIVRYAEARMEPRMEGNHLVVCGASPLDAVAQWAAENGWAGLEFATGIPGTVGGAVAGNAGAFGQQIGDRLESAVLLSRDGRKRTVSAADLEFGYRRSRLQKSGEIVVEVVLRVGKEDRARLLDERERILALRRERHPDWRVVPTAGSFFKNIEPTSAAERRQAAGWFLEQAGAKEMRVGRAHVFERHANIIVADPGATAREVLELAHKMADTVLKKFGLKLEPEVRLLGSFPAGLEKFF